MKIEQAIYGEVRSGHALRLASTRSQIVDELASRLTCQIQYHQELTGLHT
jgi:hypothetical protein